MKPIVKSVILALALLIGLTKPLEVTAQGSQIYLMPRVSVIPACSDNVQISYFGYAAVSFPLKPLRPVLIDSSAYRKSSGFTLGLQILHPTLGFGEFGTTYGSCCVRNTTQLSDYGKSWQGGECFFGGSVTIAALIPFSKPTASAADSGNICADKILTLNSKEIVETCVGAKDAGVNVKWYYRSNSDHSWTEIPDRYISLPQAGDVTSKTTATFTLNQLIEGTISSSTTYHFMIKASYDGYILESKVQSLNFMPPAPVVNGYANGSQLPNGSASCCNADNPTGVISLGTVTSIGQVRYVLRMGYDNDAIGSCDITQGTTDQIKSCLSDVECSGELGGDRKITNVPPGEYTLLIANDGGGAGACYSSYNVKIPPIEPLTLLATTPTPETCPGANDGKVRFQFSGGLLPITINGVPYNTRDITIENLAPNAYTTWTATDGCHVSP